MLEKLIDTIVLLIAALQENTAARRSDVVRINAPDAVEVTDAPATSTTPPLPPKKEKKEKAPPPPPAAEKPAAPNFAAAPAAKKSYTQEQVNEALVNAWTRLGSDENASEKCHDLLAEFGTNSVLGLKAAQYAEVIEKAEALV